MISAGEVKLRLGVSAGASERKWRFENNAGYNHFPIATRFGVEDFFFPHSVLEGMVDYTSSTRSDGGANRLLVGGRVGYKIPFFGFFSLTPTGEIGVGGGTFHAQGGLDPQDGDDLLFRGGAVLAADIQFDPRLGLELAVGPSWGMSFLEEYTEQTWSAHVTMTVGIGKSDSCYQELIHQKNTLALQLSPLREQREELLVAEALNEEMYHFVRLVKQHQQSIHAEIKTYCPKKSPEINVSFVPQHVDPIPIDGFEGLSCEEEIASVKDASEEVKRMNEDSYPKLRKHILAQEKRLRRGLQTLLNWPPLECVPFRYPPRFLLFANDNPDISLQPQWRKEVLGGSLSVYAEPVLDAALLYLGQTENKNLHLRVIAIANETSENPQRDKRLAVGRSQSVRQYISLDGIRADKDCKSDDYGLYCPYQSQLPFVRGTSAYEYIEKGFENGTFREKWIGGAYKTPRENPNENGKITRSILAPNRICPPEAYTASELFNADGVLKAEAKELFPKWTWKQQSTSPVFRAVILDFVEECPTKSLSLYSAEGKR